MNHGPRIQALRYIAGIGPKALAQASGLRLGRLLAIERGEPMTPGEALAIASALDVPPESLTGSGPLPVPRSFGDRLDFNEEVMLLAKDWIEVMQALDRLRQTAGNEYEDAMGAVRRIHRWLPWVPPAWYMLRLPRGVPVRYYIETPWFFRASTTIQVSIGGGPYEDWKSGYLGGEIFFLSPYRNAVVYNGGVWLRSRKLGPRL